MKRVLCIVLTLVFLCAVSIPSVSAAGGTVASGDVMQFGDFDLVNGHVVVYPKELESTENKYPVIVWANGTVCAPVLYLDLFKGWAKNGYVVVASSDVMSADGKDQCASIDYILKLSEDKNSQFYGKIDGSRIAAAGHSQGGRSAVNAAQRDKRIKCVISIAGSNTDGEADNLRTPTFFITGTLDLIVLSSMWVKPAYKAVSGPAVYASLRDAVHTTCITAPEKYLNYTVQWMDGVMNRNKAALKDFMPDGALSRDTGWKDYASKNMNALHTGSVLSGGSVWIVLAVVVIAAFVVFVLAKKKKKA